VSSATAYFPRSHRSPFVSASPQNHQTGQLFALNYSHPSHVLPIMDALSSRPCLPYVDIANVRAPSLRGHLLYYASSLLRPSRHPLVFGRLPGFAGYTPTLLRTISRRDEEVFSSCLACSLSTRSCRFPRLTPRGELRIGQSSFLMAAFALRVKARPSWILISRPQSRSPLLRAVRETRSLPWGDLVDRLLMRFSFPSLCLSKYGALTF